ncbi:hypothetical protein ACOPJQ_08295 [Luteimonas dalianensis]|uniref:hypothetical protein n=1 Tax=Luteimonas dalianensis TaxID=1148196 RepID=UPI003BF3CE28
MNADALATRLLELLDRDDMDAAIEAGLAGFDPDACTSLPAAGRERLAQARGRLLEAWAARERHLARNARLARRAEELRARRQAGAASTTGPRRSALPSAAAAALARARQRAGSGAS